MAALGCADNPRLHGGVALSLVPSSVRPPPSPLGALEAVALALCLQLAAAVSESVQRCSREPFWPLPSFCISGVREQFAWCVRGRGLAPTGDTPRAAAGTNPDPVSSSPATNAAGVIHLSAQADAYCCNPSANVRERHEPPAGSETASGRAARPGASHCCSPLNRSTKGSPCWM